MEDALYIRRCFDLARLGMGKVAPNPMVGCVIVNGNKIIGEGYHQEYGGYHAEVNAINSVIDKDLLKTAVLYVNLEPCAHYGKTPPCTDLIISSQIPKVVISNVDPFEKVAGKGINKLRAAGISVIVGVLKQDGKELNKRFFTFCEQKRPYIILKWAQSLDGFIDKERNSNEKLKGPTWITGDFFKKVVHKWRAEEQAIMVGTNTAINDNPKLTVREVPGKNPLRIVIDRVLKLPHNLNLFDSSTPTLVLTEQKNI
ncbi:MAG TPA: bifunctional diaminohydroxyphosphoribosylaminopyrimidine deaminase/5-amino-6-(5-phosphoribosylamino)uracil reductase RibD, partial [Bacteroidales bacterium]|nr:bifunctional diaminohydroxyphosphoribosylaminopyrimidine deaminase/5-amino-6-(5-phosphoribosylamino)uracil reductase RibD [Bacteroidales bacterium]